MIGVNNMKDFSQYEEILFSLYGTTMNNEEIDSLINELNIRKRHNESERGE